MMQIAFITSNDIRNININSINFFLGFVILIFFCIGSWDDHGKISWCYNLTSFSRGIYLISLDENGLLFNKEIAK